MGVKTVRGTHSRRISRIRDKHSCCHFVALCLIFLAPGPVSHPRAAPWLLIRINEPAVSASTDADSWLIIRPRENVRYRKCRNNLYGKKKTFSVICILELQPAPYSPLAIPRIVNSNVIFFICICITVEENKIIIGVLSARF